MFKKNGEDESPRGENSSSTVVDNLLEPNGGEY